MELTNIITHKEGFKSLKGKAVAYRRMNGDIEVIEVANDKIEDYNNYETLELDTQMPWDLNDAHFLLDNK